MLLDKENNKELEVMLPMEGGDGAVVSAGAVRKAPLFDKNGMVSVPLTSIEEPMFSPFGVVLNFFDFMKIPFGGFIAGGCFKDILLGRAPKDIDVFFTSEERYKEAVELWKIHEVLYENDAAICFDVDGNGTCVEFIKYTFGTPSDVLRAFDFTVCQMAFTGDTFIYCKRFFIDLLTHSLRLVDIKRPARTYQRMVRYCGYGFTPTFDTVVTLGNLLVKMDPATEIDWTAFYGPKEGNSGTKIPDVDLDGLPF